MVYCSECGTELNDEDKFCKNCGTENTIKPEAEIKEKINPYTGYPEKKPVRETEKEKWPKKLAIGLGVWGVINLVLPLIFGGIVLIYFTWYFGVTLIFFAVLIRASKSYKAIYAFGLIYLILALIQLNEGAVMIVGNPFIDGVIFGFVFIIVALISIAICGYAIYKTKKLDES